MFSRPPCRAPGNMLHGGAPGDRDLLVFPEVCLRPRAVPLLSRDGWISLNWLDLAEQRSEGTIGLGAASTPEGVAQGVRCIVVSRVDPGFLFGTPACAVNG